MAVKSFDYDYANERGKILKLKKRNFDNLLIA